MFGRRRFRIRGRRRGRRSASPAGNRHRHVVNLAADSLSLTAAAQTAAVMLTADDDPLDDTMTDLGGTNIAECEAGSSVRFINIEGAVQHANGGTRLIGALMKLPDGSLTNSLLATSWLNADQTEEARDFKRHILWRKVFVIPADKQQVHFRIKLSRKRSNALRRLGKMNDGDSLSLRFFNTHDSVAGSLVKCNGIIVTRR